MSTSRGSDAASLTRRRVAAADAEPGVSATHLLLRTWAGRLFLISAALKLVVGVLRVTGVFPVFVDTLSGIATIGIVVTLGFFVWRLFVLTKRRLL